jgi:hypothetical protein
MSSDGAPKHDASLRGTIMSGSCNAIMKVVMTIICSRDTPCCLIPLSEL